MLRELRRRGYDAKGIDEDGYGRWVNRADGEELAVPADLENPHCGTPRTTGC